MMPWWHLMSQDDALFSWPFFSSWRRHHPAWCVKGGRVQPWNNNGNTKSTAMKAKQQRRPDGNGVRSWAATGAQVGSIHTKVDEWWLTFRGGPWKHDDFHLRWINQACMRPENTTESKKNPGILLATCVRSMAMKPTLNESSVRSNFKQQFLILHLCNTSQKPMLFVQVLDLRKLQPQHGWRWLKGANMCQHFRRSKAGRGNGCLWVPIPTCHATGCISKGGLSSCQIPFAGDLCAGLSLEKLYMISRDTGWWFQPLCKILVRLDHHPN